MVFDLNQRDAEVRGARHPGTLSVLVTALLTRCTQAINAALQAEEPSVRLMLVPVGQDRPERAFVTPKVSLTPHAWNSFLRAFLGRADAGAVSAPQIYFESRSGGYLGEYMQPLGVSSPRQIAERKRAPAPVRGASARSKRDLKECKKVLKVRLALSFA